jgi:DNA repair protein REV1
LLNKEEQQPGLQSLFQKHVAPIDEMSTAELEEVHSTALTRDVTSSSTPKPNFIPASKTTESSSGCQSLGQNQQMGNTDRMLINGALRTVGTDPAFVENYFKSSRLSFIGSYRQRIPNSSKKTESVDIPVTARRFIYHVDMDQFFAAVVLRKYPQYRNRPVAISHLGMEKGQEMPTKNNISFKNSTSECATANYEARKYGVKKGMFLSAGFERKCLIMCFKYVFSPF